MTNFNRTNRIIAGIVFIFSAILYYSTMASTVSFWDCGEFIATSYTLGVPHPPGSPLFLILGRLFSMLPIGSDIGMRVNIISPLATSVAVMLVYLILVKIVAQLRKGLNEPMDVIMAIGGGLVGALVFAVTDSNWFNAVEAEVYAMSTLFTALTIWLILLWSEKADEPGNERYLLIIAYLIGLATGIHLLNLLTLPYIALIMYFRKTEFQWKSFLIVVLITGIGFFTINNGIIKGLPGMARALGISGVVFIVLVVVGLGVWAIRAKRPILSLIFSSLVLVLIGYSSYTLIFIRSSQDPSIDENNPDTIPAAISYLDREQYGAITQLPRKYPGLPSESEVVGAPANGGREFSGAQNREYATYNLGKQWDFFLSYQVKKMYWRYFLWQFAGRGPVGEPGVTAFGANSREDGVDWLQFGLPLALLLGLFGMFYQSYRDPKNAFSIFTLFFFTGLAVIIFLNQDNPQPRERDYSYVGSFLAFSLWIGIGAAALIDYIRTYVREKKLAQRLGAGAVVLMIIFIPGLMLRASYDQHDRTGNYVAWDMSYNFLQSCEPNAVIFTNGDNDTFPLWYLQEVEGVRKDVTVANLSLLNTPWYIKQLRDSRPAGKRFIKLTDQQIDNLCSGLQRWKTQKVRIPVANDPENKNGYIEWTLKPTFANAALKVQDMMIMRIIQDAQWRDPIYFAVTVSPTNKIGLNDYLQMEGLTFKLNSHKVSPVNTEVMEENLMHKVGDETWSKEFTPASLVDVNPDVQLTPSQAYQRGYLYRNLGNPEVYYNPQIIRLLQNYRSAYMQLAVQHYFEYQDLKKADSTDTTAIAAKKQEVLTALDKMEENIPVETIAMDARELYLQVGQLYGEMGQRDKEESIVDDVARKKDLTLREKMHVATAYIQDLKYPEKGRDILKEMYDSYSNIEQAVNAHGLAATGLDQRTWMTWQRTLPQIVSYLVMVYRDLGQTDDAAAVLQDWVKKNPKDKSAQSMLNSLQQQKK